MTKSVLITGASCGLGRAVAQCFARSGYSLTLLAHTNQQQLQQTAALCLEQGVQVRTALCDVTDAATVNRIVADAAESLPFDTLVHCAGISLPNLVPAMKSAVFDQVLATNLSGTMHVLRAAAQYLSEQKRGHLIAIGSLSGLHGIRGDAAYAAAKSGLAGLVQSMAQELGPVNVQVNMVCPGYLETDMTNNLPDARKAALVSENVLGRASSFAEVSEFIVHLAGMCHVSGQIFNLDSRITAWS